MTENPIPSEDQSKQEIKNLFQKLLKSTQVFLYNLLDLNEGTDKELTIEKIKDGIAVKNHTAWILIFSIFIASVGLNTSSTAVVIGAMLVSPLMGPILGIGLSIGINDIDTLKRSMINLGVMVGLSLITSFLFFSIPIFQEATPEILARTKPDVRDVLIATAGGLALIIALSRHRELTNTIAGIAIATALMPPLCTAGYGLATWNLNYFGGAMFLFTINAIYIALATFVIVKFLKFPVVKYLLSKKRKRIAQLASFIAILVFAFSIYSFYGLFIENRYYQNAETFVLDLKEKTGAGVINQKVDYEKKEVQLVLLGNNLSDKDYKKWYKKLPEYGLTNTQLIIQQDNKSKDLLNEINQIKNSYVKSQSLISNKEQELKEKDQRIKELEFQLNKIKDNNIPFESLKEEIKIWQPNISYFASAHRIQTNFERTDTIPVFYIEWSSRSENSSKEIERTKLWLKTRLNIDTLTLIVP